MHKITSTTTTLLVALSISFGCGSEPEITEQGEVCLQGVQRAQNACADLIPGVQADPGIDQGVVAYGVGGGDLVMPCVDSCSVLETGVLILPLGGGESDAEIEAMLVAGLADPERWIRPPEGELFIAEELDAGPVIVCSDLNAPDGANGQISCVELTLTEGEVVQVVTSWSGTTVSQLDGGDRLGLCHLYVEAATGPMNRVGDSGGPCFE